MRTIPGKTLMCTPTAGWGYPPCRPLSGQRPAGGPCRKGTAAVHACLLGDQWVMFHCWQVLSSCAHWRTTVPLAVSQSKASRTMPLPTLLIV